MQSRKFITSYATFYLKGEIKQSGNFINLKVPNTILALIPLGSKDYNVPIHQISSVETSFKMYFKNFIVGIIELFLAFSLMDSKTAVIGIILLLLGINTVLCSLQTNLSIPTTSGTTYFVSFIIFQKKMANEIAEEIRALVSERVDDTNVRMHTDRNTDRIIDAINKNK